MKDASKPFAWWFVEAFLGSQVKLDRVPETEADQAGMKEAGMEQLPQREDDKWHLDIIG